jgi:hypothetical protein
VKTLQNRNGFHAAQTAEPPGHVLENPVRPNPMNYFFDETSTVPSVTNSVLP